MSLTQKTYLFDTLKDLPAGSQDVCSTNRIRQNKVTVEVHQEVTFRSKILYEFWRVLFEVLIQCLFAE